MAVQVIDVFTAEATTPRGTFKYVKRPEAKVPHFPWQHGVTAMKDPYKVAVDVNAEVMHPSAFRIPAHARLAEGTDSAYDAEWDRADLKGGIAASYQTIEWNLGVDHDSTCKFWPIWGADTTREVALYCFAPTFDDASTGTIQLEADVDCQAFRVGLVYEPQPAVSLASGDMGGTSSSVDTRPSLAFCFAIGSGDLEKWYRVTVNDNDTFYVESKLSGDSTWTRLQSSPRRGTPISIAMSFYKAPGGTPIDAEVKLLGGKLLIRLGGEAGNSIVIDEARMDGEDPLWKFSKLRVESVKALSLQLTAAETYWSPVMTYTSPEINIGFISSLFDGLEVHYAVLDVPGWVTDLDTPVEEMYGPDVRYKATWTGPVDGTYKGESWSRFAPAVRAVVLKYSAYEEYMPEAAVPLSPSSWMVQHTFNPDTLSIETIGELGFNSNKPTLLPSGATGTWGSWIIDTGQFALTLSGSRSRPDGSMPANVRQFTGYGNTSAVLQAESGNAGAKIRFSSRSRQLSNSKPYLPWSDGWNVFYFMYFYGQMGGISKDDMAFKDSIPASPYDDSVDEDGNPAWFLPIGVAQSMLVRPTLGESLWLKMLRVAREGGYMLYMDLFGKMQFRKFRLGSGSLKRTFFESDPESYAQPGGGLEGCWSISVEKSMDQVRSRLTLVGPKPYQERGELVSTFATDPAVVDDGNSFNHLGYDCDAAWVDTQFSTEDYSLRAAGALFPTLRTPFLAVNLTSWYQPDIYPLDKIMVSSAKLGLNGIPLIVLSARSASPPGGPAFSQITGLHFLPE